MEFTDKITNFAIDISKGVFRKTLSVAKSTLGAIVFNGGDSDSSSLP